jgi:hypothetical protein
MNIDDMLAWWQLLFLGLWVVASAWLTVRSGRVIAKSYSASNWDQVCVEILEIKYDGDENGDIKVGVRYKYSYSGKIYEGNTAFFESFDSIKEVELREFEKVLASSKAFVNPVMPTESVIWNHVTGMARFRAVAFLIVSLGAIAFFHLRLAFGPFSGDPDSGPT